MIVLPTKSLANLRHFLVDHRDLMFRYMLKEVTKAMRSDVEKIDLLRFGDTNFFISCYRPEYALVIEQALSYFIEKEMYEEAAKCRDLITKIKVEGIISSSVKEN